MRRALCSVPAALSSIFSPKIWGMGERPLGEVGARGGGFSFVPGVDTVVELNAEEGDECRIVVNGVEADFLTSMQAVNELRRRLKVRGAMKIVHRFYAPIGAGFGSSAGAALGVILALSKLAGKPMTLCEAIRLTHEIELKCGTGLNSEVGLMASGLILVLREGVPPRGLIDMIPLPLGAKLVCVIAGKLRTDNLLRDFDKLREIEEIGDKFLAQILEKPSPENFLRIAREFARETGLLTRELEEVFEAAAKLPVIGYAQNMVGNAAHILLHGKHAKEVLEDLRSRFPDYEVKVFDLTRGSGVYLD